MKKLLPSKRLNSIALALVLTGCVSQTALSPELETVANVSWSDAVNQQVTQEKDQVKQWLNNYSDSALQLLVKEALINNHTLQAQYFATEQTRARLAISDSTDWPSLSLNASNSRRKTVTGEAENYSTSASINLQLSYELDIWGKLNNEQQQAYLSYSAAQATYLQTQLDTIANVTKLWFSVLEAKTLLSLYENRAKNLNQNLAMIESSYQLGLGRALDVYLTKNDVNRELARIAEQTQTLDDKIRALELSIGRYPSADKTLAQASVDLTQMVKTLSFNELPSDVVKNRPDLQAAWFDLMASDAGLAVAHKNRFPSLSISGSLSDSGEQLSDLLSGNPLAWSLIGNLTAPIFNAGRLAAQEEQAKLQVQQKEALYLQRVYAAFSEIESTASKQYALNQRYQHFLAAEQNALAAEKLSFEQYLKGLVTYTTVLESQRRAFDAQTTVIQLQHAMINNQVVLLQAIGGSPVAIDDITAELTTEPNKRD